MKYDRLWERLVEALDGWASAREVELGWIEVSLPATGSGERVVHIVMTPDEWDDMVSVAFGGFDYALDYVKETLNGMDGEDTFAVHATYDLVPSPTPVLPVDPQTQRLHDLARKHPKGIGGWFTYERDSSERHEYPEARD